ncbi:MAG: lysophospholipid acyltransferase family protein [Planctomycetota bacterium]
MIAICIARDLVFVDRPAAVLVLMKHLLYFAVGILVGCLRASCRLKVHNDCRSTLYQQGYGHVFAALHAHQIAGLISSDRGMAAMASRSDDGGIVVPAIRACGGVPIRGSSGPLRKGGGKALQQMIRHVSGRRPAVITVDGPRGPRGVAKPGITLLAQKANAKILCTLAIPSDRWLFCKSWDRLQIPKPFSTIHVYLSDPITVGPNDNLADKTLEVQRCLAAMEAKHDPDEAAHNEPVTEAMENKLRRRAA